MSTSLHAGRQREAHAPRDPADLEQDFIDANGIVRSFFELLAATDRSVKVNVSRIGNGGLLAAEAAERAFYNLLDAYLSERPGKAR